MNYDRVNSNMAGPTLAECAVGKGRRSEDAYEGLSRTTIHSISEQLNSEQNKSAELANWLEELALQYAGVKPSDSKPIVTENDTVLDGMAYRLQLTNINLDRIASALYHLKNVLA